MGTPYGGPILKIPKFKKEFCVETDASLNGPKAILSQSQFNIMAIK